MQKKAANLAVVTNNTFEAFKADNLTHYDISSALQTTLEFDELVHIFSNKIQNLIPHSGFVYSNEEFDLEIKNGIVTRSSCSYAMKVEEQQLGELKLMRRQKFSEQELTMIETLLCCLIYPLRNATLFQQAMNLAFTDVLTQTRNRSAFNDIVRREIRLAHRNGNHLSVIFIDIDHFKSINDNYGHQCGDLALTSVAKWINESIRSSDIVFRYGGEEFVVLLSETDLDGAELLAERIRQNIENHIFAYGLETIRMTASLGTSTLRGDDTLDKFIDRADQAMYRAKQTGRNRVVTA
ncbi:GGDEF domain-containing protein [Methylotuvimicrobium alcaliphilum]|uniref:diguanylate cyclase n=1 Tax=Methylotuvimicrobium alcaliphilum (strain DSM 19304 / NCIMB 14124 / VKM B-2133 / 20Z) TaxID=1091494 RepID=G4SYR2_META2|nr:GGDEF domain-containing protein [Methylotuvimicrobium alcaliphilum]CCE24359.1 Diguanylate cyclase [Methylotuvimicrobium alcaliphilum 20Z]